MKPPPFSYEAPRTVEEALGVLAEGPAEAVVLAGGQSLIPALNMRLAEPARVVDINRVQGLDVIDRGSGRVWIGATVRQRQVERDAEVASRVPLLTEAVQYIAHPAIRTRGTICGSLAHADPAAELPAAIAALDGLLHIRSTASERSVAAADFFKGPLTTAIQPGELLVGVEVPEPPEGSGAAFVEVTRTHGAFALAAAAALLHLDTDGCIDRARLALAGVGSVPHVLDADDVLVGDRPSRALFEAVGRRAAEEVQPFDDIHATAAYRRRVAGTLATKALEIAASRSGTVSQ